MSVMDEYVFEERPPTPEEHLLLRTQAGLTPHPRPDSDISLRNTWYGVTVRHRGEAVGMGRIIGDGAIFLVVVDVAILPSHQHKGLGGQIMSRLVVFADAHAPNAHMSLMADPPGVGLYKKHGFAVEPYETPMLRSQYFTAMRKQLGLGEFKKTVAP